MLSKMLKLPFRRDAVERVIRDAIQRGKSPELRMLGQIGASFACGRGKPPNGDGNRLVTPALVRWRKNFALAIESNAEGLKLASPSQELVQLTSLELADHFLKELMY